MNLLYPSSGALHYNHIDGYGYKLVVEVNSAIVDLARALVPKWIELNSTRYAPHISVVRRETPTNLTMWGKYEGEQVPFEYSPEIHYDNTYFWLRVFSKRLVEIRVELGLPPSRLGVTCPPDGEAVFHVTVGNRKGLD